MADGNIDKRVGGKIGIVGSGLIGRSWAMLFAAADFEVFMYDVERGRVDDALADIRVQLTNLEETGLLRGRLTADEQHSRVHPVDTLQECLSSAVYVQECVPENLELKHKIFVELNAIVDDKTILASSTSSLPASKFASDLTHSSQVIVVHPVNPPFYCPLVEVVPMPVTHRWVTERTMALMNEIGQSPVHVKKEVTGFALNRVQYSLLAECWRLVEDDVLSVEDVDKLMKDGLGMRYAFMGPFETCHLNADGFQDYLERYSFIVNDTQATFGPPVHCTPDSDTARHIIQELETKLPADQRKARCLWRNQCLAGLAKLKSQLPR